MTDINDLRTPVLAMNNLPNVDGAYTMHDWQLTGCQAR